MIIKLGSLLLKFKDLIDLTLFNQTARITGPCKGTKPKSLYAATRDWRQGEHDLAYPRRVVNAKKQIILRCCPAVGGLSNVATVIMRKVPIGKPN